MYNMTANDEADVKRVVALYAKMENELQDISDLLKIKEELLKYQPFVLSIITGYQIDVPDPDEFEPILKLYLFIWMYYMDNKAVRKTKITESMYVKEQDEIIEMLRQSEKSDNQEKDKLANKYIEQLQSKALMTFILFLFVEDPILQKLDRQAGGAVLIGYKTILKCFEKIAIK
jgi:hypothetical protein